MFFLPFKTVLKTLACSIPFGCVPKAKLCLKKLPAPLSHAQGTSSHDTEIQIELQCTALPTALSPLAVASVPFLRASDAAKRGNMLALWRLRGSKTRAWPGTVPLPDRYPPYRGFPY